MNSAFLELPIEQRIQLVEDLWDSIAAEQGVLPLTSAQRDELDKRLDAYESDRNAGRPAAEAIAGIKQRL